MFGSNPRPQTRWIVRHGEALLLLAGMSGAAWACCRPGTLLSGEILVLAPATHPWWMDPKSLFLAFFALAIASYAGVAGVHRSRWLALACSALALACAVGLFRKGDDRPEAERQSCANCRSFMLEPVVAYARAHDGWFPRGGPDPWASLSMAIEPTWGPHNFTSHALQPKLAEEWARSGRLTEDTCCYGYNEGLRLEDQGPFILFYYRWPGRWECSHHRKDAIGRVCLLYDGSGSWSRNWEFLEEARFQALQQSTLEFIRRRDRDRDEWDRVRSELVLRVVHHRLPEDWHRFGAVLRNRGERTLRLSLESAGLQVFESPHEESTGGCPTGERLVLAPDEEWRLPREIEVRYRHQWSTGGYTVQSEWRSDSGTTSAGEGSYSGALDREAILAGYRVEARVTALVETDEAVPGRRAVTVPLCSEPVRFLVEDEGD